MYGQRNLFGQKQGQRQGFRAFRGQGRGQGMGQGFRQGQGCGHGGARAGAGRPSRGFCQRVQLRLTDEQKEFWLNSPELQDEIRELIDKKITETKNQ